MSVRHPDPRPDAGSLNVGGGTRGADASAPTRYPGGLEQSRVGPDLSGVRPVIADRVERVAEAVVRGPYRLVRYCPTVVI
jgi:hypothetical protein